MIVTGCHLKQVKDDHFNQINQFLEERQKIASFLLAYRINYLALVQEKELVIADSYDLTCMRFANPGISQCYFCCYSFHGFLDTKPDVVAMGLLSMFSAIALVQLPASLFYRIIDIVWKVVEKSNLRHDTANSSDDFEIHGRPFFLSQTILMPSVLSELASLFEHDIYDVSRCESNVTFDVWLRQMFYHYTETE